MSVQQYIPFRQKNTPFSVHEVTGGLNPSEVLGEIERGARFVVFPYIISAIYISYHRRSPVRFLKPGESPLPKALPYALLSFFFGWWGFPNGILNTPGAIYQTLRGGKDITPSVLAWAQKYSEGAAKA